MHKINWQGDKFPAIWLLWVAARWDKDEYAVPRFIALGHMYKRRKVFTVPAQTWSRRIKWQPQVVSQSSHSSNALPTSCTQWLWVAPLYKTRVVVVVVLQSDYQHGAWSKCFTPKCHHNDRLCLPQLRLVYRDVSSVLENVVPEMRQNRIVGC